ncbi:MAG: DNA polymerase IV [Nitrososphaerota archaeon]|nr:DNA polymerase IV [Nitrososphaerota archaeon]
MSRYNERVILAIDLDYFFAQCEEIRKPEIKGKPVVVCVYSGRTEESGAVSTCNYIARKLGVRSGIPIIQAKRILSGNNESVFLPVDNDYYETISERIMEILGSRISRMEQVSVDEAYLDVTSNTSGDYSAAQTIATQIKKNILDSESLTCSIGIGPNKLVAKMAVDYRKPDGLTIVQPDQVRLFLNPLPVGRLFGVGPKTEQRLASLGILTVKNLANFSAEVLAKEFGKKLGPSLRQAALGIDEDQVQEREPEQLSRIVTLKHDAIEFCFANELQPLCRDISEKLDSKGLLCNSISIIVITMELKTKNRTRTLKAPTNSADEIFSAVSEMFKSYFGENPESRVRRVGVKVSSLVGAKTSRNVSLTEFFSQSS